MTKKRLRVSLISIIIGCLLIAGTTYAKPSTADAESMYSKEIIAATNAEVSSIQPRNMCEKCSSIVQMKLKCFPETRRFSGQSHHKYGVLWSKTCTVVSYDANAAYYCDVCGNTIVLEDNEQPDGLARHHCLEVHSGCGAGNNGQYRVCPFEE